MGRLINIFFVLILFAGCGQKEAANNAKKVLKTPCSITVVLSGNSPDVHFTLYSKANEKIITIDRQLNLVKQPNEEFSFSSYLGGSFSAQLQTKDSYGPEVKIEVFINGKPWRAQTDNYNPIIEGIVPQVIK